MFIALYVSQNSLTTKFYLHSTDEVAWLLQTHPGRVQTQACLILKATLIPVPSPCPPQGLLRTMPQGLSKLCATWRIFLGCWESHWEISQEMWCLGARLGDWSNMASNSLLVAPVCRQWVVLGQSPDYYHGTKRQFAKNTQRRRTRLGPRCSDSVLRNKLSVLGTRSSPRNLQGLLVSYSVSICFSCSGSCLPLPPPHGHFLTLPHTGPLGDTQLGYSGSLSSVPWLLSMTIWTHVLYPGERTMGLRWGRTVTPEVAIQSLVALGKSFHHYPS